MFANLGLIQAANADFATLSLNWLLNRDVFLADIPPRAITEYTLSITERQMLTLRWIFMFGAPAVALLIGTITYEAAHAQQPTKVPAAIFGTWVWNAERQKIDTKLEVYRCYVEVLDDLERKDHIE